MKPSIGFAAPLRVVVLGLPPTSRVSVLFILLALSPCLIHAQRSVVMTRAATVPVQIDLYEFEFKEPYLGREGPSYSAIKGEPSRKAQQLAEARLSGQAGISTVQFEAIDASGNALKVLHLFKVNDALDDDEYLGFVDVPDQPFRVMVSGQDINGAAYQRVYDRLFRPKDELPTPAALASKLLLGEEKRYKAEFAAKRRANPDGVIVLAHMQVTNVMHEPYKTASGNTLGIRLSYDIQFSKAAVYSMTPSVSPFYENLDFRGSVAMKVAGNTINPQPESLPQQYPPGFHGFIMPAQYQSGVVYHFVVDMVPDFAIQNGARTKYCIYSRKFQNSSKASGMWETLKTQDVPVRYLVSIESVNFHGEIQGLYPQKTFYEGLLGERAQDCGPSPNINF
jgi:hypothetical protein